jgi:hypothetical protein
MENAFKGRSAIYWSIVFGKHRDDLLLGIQPLANVDQIGIFAFFQCDTTGYQRNLVI